MAGSTTIGNVYIRIGAKTDKLTGDLKAADREIRAFGKKAKEVGSSMTQNITLPIIGVGAGALKAYADIESLQKGLIAVMGSSAAASAEFEKLKEVAKLPGLGLEEAARGSVSLQSAGFSADQAREALLQFGNALATVGKGKNELNLVTLALTQLQNKSSGFGQDLRQLLEQLPQMRAALVDAFGTADSEEIAKMGVTGKQVVEQLIAEFSKLPRVTGGLKNSFENASDSIKIAFANLGESLNKNLDIEGVINGLAESISNLANWFNGLSSAQQKLLITFTGIIAAIGPLTYAVGAIAGSFSSVIAAIKVVGATASVALGPVGIAIAAISAALAAGIFLWSESAETAEEAAQREKVELENLVRAAKDNNENAEVRSALYDEIQKKYPDYLKNIDLEKEGIDGLNKVLETYNNSNTIAAAREKDKQMQIIELQKKKAKIIQQIIDAEKNPDKDKDLKQSMSGFTSWGNFEKNKSFGSKQFVEVWKQSINTIDKEIKALQSTITQVGTDKPKDDSKGNSGGGGGGVKKETGYTLADFKNEIAAVDVLVQTGFLTSAEALDEKLQIITSAAKKFADKGLKPTSKELQTVIDLQNQLKTFEALPEDINLGKGITIQAGLVFQDSMPQDVADKMAGKDKITIPATPSFEEMPDDVAVKAGLKDGIVIPTTADIDKMIDEKKLQDKIANMANSIKKVLETMADIGTILNPVLELSGQLLDNQMAKIDQKQQKEKAAVEATVTNEDEKAKRLKAIDEKYDKEKKKIQRKQAIAAKVSGVFNAIVSAYEGAAKALAIGGPAGLILSGIIKAMGFANAAAIAAAPLPSLAIGTNMVKSDGLANIHRGEAIVPARVVSGGFSGVPNLIQVVGKIAGTDIILGSKNSSELYNRMYA